MRFVCFGGAAAVADVEAVAVVVASHRRSRRHRWGMPSLFRGKLSSGNKGEKESAASAKVLPSPGRRGVDFYDMIAAARAAAKSSSAAASVPSSSALSSAASLDSSCSSSSCSSSSSSRSSTSSSSPFLEGVPPAPAAEKRSPAAGAVAVLLCLVMIVFCGRFSATLLTSAAFFVLPRRWPARAWAPAESAVVDGAAASPEHVVASLREEETMKRKVVTDGFLVRNRKN